MESIFDDYCVMVNNSIITGMSATELQDMITECVNACLKHFIPTQNIQESKTPGEEITYDIAGLAQYLGCSVQTIHNLKKEGVIPFYRLGRKVYFKKSEIDANARVAAITEKKGGRWS